MRRQFFSLSGSELRSYSCHELSSYLFRVEHAVVHLVYALRYKPEGRGFDWNFYLHNPSSPIMALGSTQPLTEISTRAISCGVKAAGA